MSSHVDILEQRESLKSPLLLSAAVHGLVFSLIVLNASLGDRGRVLWGNPRSLGGGGSVGITAVSQIPLPARSGPANPLANDTESRVPRAPEPAKARPRPAAPKPDLSAIPLPGAARAPRRPQYRGQYQAEGARPNQLYSQSGQALSSPMFSAQTGTGGVGIGPGSAFGERFGGYRDLLEQRVAQKWRTDDVDPRLQTAPPVIVTFTLLRDGSIRNVRIESGSGNRALDLSAQRAIYAAAPFPPLPREYERSSAQIEFWFQLKR